jgi:solute carrier family 25 uncoupling protein 8/9
MFTAGLGPNVARNAIVTACELVSYDLIKENILRRNLMSDNMPCHFVSAFGAGLVTTIIASPVDVVKTRFMNSPAGSYRGALHCAYRMLTNEGPFAFYKGLVFKQKRTGNIRD